MFSNYYLNLLLFDEKSFLNFLRSLGFEITLEECADIMRVLKEYCSKNNPSGSANDFEIWVRDIVQHW
ncbi:MAG: hypothetical protein U9M98_01485 [Patescibacteria group bacterium]|nr:hypothetical protein [Patescibacteria group bacterium]